MQQPTNFFINTQIPQEVIRKLSEIIGANSDNTNAKLREYAKQYPVFVYYQPPFELYLIRADKLITDYTGQERNEGGSNELVEIVGKCNDIFRQRQLILANEGGQDFLKYYNQGSSVNINSNVLEGYKQAVLTLQGYFISPELAQTTIAQIDKEAASLAPQSVFEKAYISIINTFRP